LKYVAASSTAPGATTSAVGIVANPVGPCKLGIARTATTNPIIIAQHINVLIMFSLIAALNESK
jgi:hypothetical protein